MNKKKIIILLIIILCLSGLICLAISIRLEKNFICQEYGYEKYVYDGKEYCEDKDNNLYYMYFDCDWYPLEECISKSITIGYNNRTK